MQNLIIAIIGLPLVVWIVLYSLQKYLKFNFIKNKKLKKMAIGLWFLLTITGLTFFAINSEPTLGRLEDHTYDGIGTILKSVAYFLVALAVTKIVKVFVYIIRNRYSIDSDDNLKHRKIHTQIQFVEKIVVIIVWILAIGLMLLSYEKLEKIGTGILASAGVASIVLGFAAQKSLTNLIAGFQIAFTQPLRIDDAVVIEGEWGWVEEITLTYLVVRIWDERRLVLPISYIVENPFQNWTRTTSQILGTVHFFVNYNVDMAKLKEKYKEIVESSELWDGRVQVLQVVDFKEQSIELRGLVSAKSSPNAWDLRCYVREQLIKYLQEKDGGLFPKINLSSSNFSVSTEKID